MKRFVCCLFIVAVLPLVTTSHQTSNNNLPVATIVLAGETTPGARCDCSQPGCICPSQPTNTTSVAPTSNPIADPSLSPENVDFGLLALTLFLALIVFAKLGL